MENTFDDSSEQQTALDVLAYAMSDVGLWTWWSEKFPDVLQLEFNRTMLYFSAPSTDRPPSNQIALVFQNPTSVTLMTRNGYTLPDHWLDDFHADKLEPLGMDYEYCSFNPADIKSIIDKAEVLNTVHGAEIRDVALSDCPISLSFWAEDVGLVVCAEAMKIITHDGAVALDQIPDIHNKWWVYWRQYWSVINTNKRLPYDPLCEITIPAGKFDMDQPGASQPEEE